MALHIPDQAEEIFLDLMLAGNTQLKLHTNDVTAGLTESQINALTEADFTEATFTGYTAKTLTGGSWVTTPGSPSTGTYAQQTFTRTSTGSAQVVYGYHVVRSSDGKLLWHERFTGPVSTSTNGDTIRVTPTITFEDDQEATVAARGIVGTPYSSTSDDTARTTSGLAASTAIADVPTDSTRVYKIHFHSGWGMIAAGRWLVEVRADGVTVGRVGDTGDWAAASNGTFHAALLWYPDTGTPDLTVYQTEVSGSATFTLIGASSTPRQLWVEDIGPR